MQSQVSVDYMTTLKKGISLSGKARLIAEWNMNRFAGPVAVVNTGVSNVDSDEFPIESVVSPNRPSKDGILKARVVSNARWVAGNKTLTEGVVSPRFDDVSQSTTALVGKKGYTVSSESKYKYWSSATPSSNTLASGGYAVDNGALELTYAADIWCNKIVVNFEATAADPKDITVSYKTTPSGGWTNITGTFQVDSDGRLIIYRQANDSWSTTEYNLNPFKIRGIKVTVPRMSKPGTHLNIIEVSARLQSDISDFLIDDSVTNSMSDPSLVTPLGTCSSNQANVTLSNIDGRFDTAKATLRDSAVENLFYGLIDKNIYMKLDFGLVVNGVTEWTRQFTMWTDEWGSPGEESTEVSLKDSSKILQEAKPNETLYQGLSTAGIVWRMCDAIGFNNYEIPASALNDNSIIDFYWTDAEKTVWEHFQEIAEATQTAIFFDEYDVLRVLPRNSAYDLTKPVAWTFDAEEVPTSAPGRPTNDYGKLADIIELQQGFDYEANIANVKYTPTAVAKMQGTVPVMEQAWSPEGDVVLRSSRLIQTMASNATSFRITPTEAKLWPYTGTIQVEGEFIKYVRKSYTYRNGAGVWLSSYIASEEDRLKLDALNPGLAWANYFNGYIDCTGGRGQWGTTAKAHTVDLSGWTTNRYRIGTAAIKAWNGGLIHDKTYGLLKLQTNKGFTPNSWYVSTRGSSADAAPYWYGTRVRFPTSGYTYGAAGLALSVNTNDAGYYVELVRTSAITPTDRAKYTYELCFYVRYTNGTIKRFGPNGGKGIAMTVVPGIWYDLDVKFEHAGATKIVSVMVNGVTRMTASFTTGQGTGEAISGRYGLFTRGFSAAEFEYIYSSTTPVMDEFDQEGWFDRINGGYQSSQYDREWTYNQRFVTKLRYKKPPLKVTSRYSSRLMDEFGPVIHEVREYNVKFEKKPMIHTNLYLSNDKQVIVPEYSGTPFGASFVLANTSRVNAIVNGQDTLTFGIDNPVEQKILIYGREVKREEQATETVKNETAINRRGAVEIDIDSEWIQSKTTAKNIGSWITQHWGGGSDEITIDSIGNPLIQLGDLVAVNNPDKGMTYATHRYFVVGVTNSFDGGLSTTLTLRRAKV